MQRPSSMSAFYFITTKTPQKPTTTIPDMFYRNINTYTRTQHIITGIRAILSKIARPNPYGRSIGEITTLTNHWLEDYLKCRTHIVSPKSVCHMMGGWVGCLAGSERIEEGEKPHHIILKEKYKPHEPANSILFQIANGSAYVFKWKWQCGLAECVTASTLWAAIWYQNHRRCRRRCRRWRQTVCCPFAKYFHSYHLGVSSFQANLHSVCNSSVSHCTVKSNSKYIYRIAHTQIHDKQLAFSFAMSAQKLSV